ncbi:MAG: PKD domain-containing protein, partial [Bacteroidota bacterium]|nr:PKD domain-containing protein [Bacteroidota bacterium]
VFQKADTFFVKLTATSNHNCKDSITKSVIVNPSPKADFSINDSSQCLIGNNCIYKNISSISVGNITPLWFIDEVLVSSIDSFKNTYHHANFYKVKLVVTSDKGCKDSIKKITNIHPMPKIEFSVNDTFQCLSGNNFVFTNRSSIAIGTLQSLWNFGDSVTSTKSNPSHSYNIYGTFDVKLEMISGLGCKDDSTMNVFVYPMPEAKFENKMPCLDKNIIFFNNSEVDFPDVINEWYWDFKDNSFDSLESPTHIFTTSKNYDILHVVTTNHGCKDSFTKKLYFYDHVIANEIDRATVFDDKEILIEWTENQIGNPKFFKLERSIDSISFYTIDSFGVNTIEFIDKFVDVHSNSYIYRIQTIDSCEYESPYSNIGKSILLTIDTTQEYSILHWTAYQDWQGEVSEYEIQIFDENFKDFKTIAYADKNTFLFIDDKTNLNQYKYCYRIKAIRTDGIESISNEVCIPTEFHIYAPNTFTPNEDEINNSFQIKGTFIIEYNIKIYNRWGEQVFESNDIHDSWDGKYKGKVCPVGAYYYQIYAKGTMGRKES